MTWPSASGGGYDRQVDPGDVNPPAIFEPSTSIIQGSSPQLWIAASGGKNWGGALVSVSFDGVNYDYVGTLTSPAFQGVLTAGITNSGSPLSIDLTQSAGVLPTAATHADQVAKRTLSYVCPAYVISGGSATVPGNGELLAYGAVAATGTYTNNLTDLNRGLYGTTAASHSSGDFFTRIDLGELDTPPNSVLTYTLPPQYIGATVHVKFQSFNVFGNATQDISTVAEFIYTPSGAAYGGGSGGTPTTPTGLAAFARGTAGDGWNMVEWTANPSTDNVQFYTVLRRFSGVGSYASIGTTPNTQFADNTAITGLAYDYELTATNPAGTSSAAGPVTVTTL